MNIYTGLLFLHGHILDADQFAEPAHAAADYGPSYGNRVANARVLRERWERDNPPAGREDDIDDTPRAA
jgi:hypothetical protein